MMAAIMLAAAAGVSLPRYDCLVEKTFVAARDLVSKQWKVETMSVTDAPTGANRFTVVMGDGHHPTRINWPGSVFGIKGSVQGAWTNGKFMFLADRDNCLFMKQACVATGEFAPISASAAQFSIVVATKAMLSKDSQPFLFQPLAFGSCNKVG